MAFPADIGRSPTVTADPGTAAPTASGTDTGDDGLRVATYNLGGANEYAKQTEHIRSSTRVLAEAMVYGGVDVTALQEIDVGTHDAYKSPYEALVDRSALGDNVGLPDGFADYNEYALAQISAVEAGLLEGELGKPIVFTRTEGVDSNGIPTVTITGTDGLGRSSSVTITRESYTADGRRLPPGAEFGHTLASAFTGQDDLLPLTVYTAHVATPDGLREYSIAYGPSRLHDGGSYGNSILVGPDAQLRRDADGNLDVARYDLGANDPESGENRTALKLGIVAGGEALTIFNAHLTHGISEVEDYQEGQRGQQIETLDGLVSATGGNTVLLGDFNSEGFADVGSLSGSNIDANFVDFRARERAAERREALGLPVDSNIDRIYTSDDLDVDYDDRTELIAGGSDHEMVIWDVDLGIEPPDPPPQRDS